MANAAGTRNVLESFAQAIHSSKAVLCRSLLDLDRMATSTENLYATYYGLIEGGVRVPSDDDWDEPRRLADEVLFPYKKKQVRFAALSLDGTGLSNYGDCSIALREDMIEHRASVFESNSAQLIALHQYKMPLGYRAGWAEREKLSVAKHQKDLRETTTTADFQGLLLKDGSSSQDDRYIEVHIWGSLSVCSFERVTFRPKGRKPSRATLAAIKERLDKAGVAWETK